MAGSRASSGRPGRYQSSSRTLSAPRAATAIPRLSSSFTFERRPWWREMTISGVHFPGFMPKSRNSIGRSAGFFSASATAAFTPSTNEVTMSSPLG
jgi:hypothetical protein